MAQFFLKVFQSYYRLQLKRDPIGKLDFTDHLTPTFA